MEKRKKGHPFLSGFANEKIIEDIYVSDNKSLRPGTVVSENKNQYKIEIGIPFMTRKDIKVSIENEQLIIDGKKGRNEHGEGKRRRYKGIFQLPPDVLIRDLHVSFQHGLLKIVLPKKKIVRQFQTTLNR